MNFIPPSCLQDNAPPIKYVPKGRKTAEPPSTPKAKRKASLASLFNRDEPEQGPPPVPEIPAAFATPTLCTPKASSTLASSTKASSTFSANETLALDRPGDTSAIVREGLVVSGVSFMDLDSSDSGSADPENPAFLRRIRRVLSKTDLSAQNGSSPSVPASSPSIRSLVPSSPTVDGPGLRARVRRLTDASGSIAQRTFTSNNGSSADLASLRSLNSSKSHSSKSHSSKSHSSKSHSLPRAKIELSSKLRDNPPLDPDFGFNEFITGSKTISAPSPRMENRGRPGRSAPPIDSPSTRRFEAFSVQTTRESVDGHASYLSQPKKTGGLPMTDMVDKDLDEWIRAVKFIKGTEVQRAADEAKAAKVKDKQLRSEESQRSQQERDKQVKIELAQHFIRRTSKSWVPRQNSRELRTDEGRQHAIAEALYLGCKNEESDPGFTELRERYFTGITKPSSRSREGNSLKPAPLSSIPGWNSASASISSFTRAHQTEAGGSTTTLQTFATCPASPAGSGFSEYQPSPSMLGQSATDQTTFDGLGIRMKTPDPNARDINMDGRGQSFLAIPASPGHSLRSQRNAFSPGQARSLYTPQQSPQHPSSKPSSGPTVYTATDDAESRERLQASASATLANTKVFKVDRDSKIQDRYVPKRGSTFNQTIEAAREFRQASMGMPTGPLPPLPFPRKDSVIDNSPTPVKKVQPDPSSSKMFKKASKYPALRAMVSSLSLRTPDATEIVQSPVTPNSAIHPALRSSTTSPVTPSTKSHRPTMAQRLTGRTSRTSTSTTSSDHAMSLLSASVPKSPSQKSLVSTTTADERWAQRIRQKSKVEQAWKDNGVLNAPSNAPAQQPPFQETPAPVSATKFSQSPRPAHTAPLGTVKVPMVETPTSPSSLPSNATTASISSPKIDYNTSPHLERKTQDSPTPLNIRKVTPASNVQHGLSLPDSPASLHVSKLRTHPAVRRVLQQDFTKSPEAPTHSSSSDSDKDPFAKSGSEGKGDQDWPLSDTSTNKADSDERQYGQTPTDGAFDDAVTTWRHASAGEAPLTLNSPLMENAKDAGKHIREHLKLKPLLAPTDGSKVHPYHPHDWASTNVMCKDLHIKPRSPHETAEGSVRFCSYCRETCCYYGMQVVRAGLQVMGRDQAVEDLKHQAQNHIFYLQGVCPDGIEDYQVLMECDLCERLCCPTCTSVCQYPFCPNPVCKACVDVRGGVCAMSHG